MSIKLQWHDSEKKILHVQFAGAWTWENFLQTARDVCPIIEQAPHSLNLLIDGTNSAGLPGSGAAPFQYINQVREMLPYNTGAIVIITRRRMVRMVLSVANRFYEGQDDIHITNNMDDANAILSAYVSQNDSQNELITALLSPDWQTAMSAVEELRTQNWLYDGSLMGAELHGVDWHSGDLFMANMEQADMRGGNFSEANLFMSKLAGANFQGANFTRTGLTEASLAGANLREAIFEGAECTPTDFSQANLQEAKMAGVNLTSSHFIDAILANADLRHAQMSRIVARNAVLKGAQCHGVQVVFADFNHADCSGATFTRADMRHANLQMANFMGANLTGANLQGARLWGTNFQNANLDDVVMRECHFDGNTVLPDGAQWSPSVDMQRYTNPKFEGYWRNDLTSGAPQHPDDTIATRDVFARIYEQVQLEKNNQEHS